ncbi:hypothetical protein ACH4VR_36300 [Streptomyces sp. NPDC020883]|uniref:hypothetical protein n=1 Tax=Streptomyces sp. NPDC020883 TaxID=3365099 RepID=UPI00379D438C
MSQAPSEQRLFAIKRALHPARPGVCAGQQRLEAFLVDQLVEHDWNDSPSREGIYGIVAATAGPSCLHLQVSDIQLGFLTTMLCPDLWGVEGELFGFPGLRVVEEPDRLMLRTLHGHGRIIFHLGPSGHRPWKEWRGEEYEICRTPRCSPAQCPQAANASDAVPLLHDLRDSPALHPLERDALAAPVDTSRHAVLSHELRQALRALPSCEQAHSPSRSRWPRRVLLGTRPLVLAPEAFRCEAQLRVEHVADVSDALARQLLDGLTEGAFATGDLLLDIKGIIARICGSRPVAARWGQSAFLQVASRTALLRYRRRRSDDLEPLPSHGRAYVWEIAASAAAASLLCPVVQS